MNIHSMNYTNCNNGGYIEFYNEGKFHNYDQYISINGVVFNYSYYTSNYTNLQLYATSNTQDVLNLYNAINNILNSNDPGYSIQKNILSDFYYGIYSYYDIKYLMICPKKEMESNTYITKYNNYDDTAEDKVILPVLGKSAWLSRNLIKCEPVDNDINCYHHEENQLYKITDSPPYYGIAYLLFDNVQGQQKGSYISINGVEFNFDDKNCSELTQLQPYSGSMEADTDNLFNAINKVLNTDDPKYKLSKENLSNFDFELYQGHWVKYIFISPKKALDTKPYIEVKMYNAGDFIINGKQAGAKKVEFGDYKCLDILSEYITICSGVDEANFTQW